MSAEVTVPSGEWELLKRLDSEASETQMLEAAVRIGRPHLRHENDEQVVDSTPAEALTHIGAEVAIYRVLIADGREAVAEAERQERDAYGESVDLDTRVLPALKEEAKRLRAEILQLESSLAERGMDPSEIDPAMPIDAIVVDEYRGPAYDEASERSRAAVEFFRRIRPDEA
jgi:hypothetical protein